MGCFPRAIYEAPKKERNTSVKQSGRFCGAAVSVHDVTDIGRGRTKITMPQYRRTDMDYKELIENLERRGMKNGSSLGEHSGLYEQAAYAITDLLARSEEAEARAEKAERERDAAISDMEALMWHSGDGCNICAHSVEVHKTPYVRLTCDLKGKSVDCTPKWRGQKEE